jgi:serine/threonine protein kinase
MSNGLQPGSVLAETYRVERLIGQGGMGSVYEASHLRVPRRFAIKTLLPEVAQAAGVFDRFQREAEIASALGSEHIVQVFDFNRAHDGTPYMVMELLLGGELFKRVHRTKISEREAASLMLKLADALDYLHSKKILHRDIKLENILLLKETSVDVIKIIDFGFASKIENIGVLKKCGTPGYAAPELLLEKDYSYKADFFSLGVCLFIMLCGKPAFRGQTFQEILICNSVCHFRFSRHLWTGITYSAIDIVKNLMHPDPLQRYDYAKIMRHPWILHYTNSIKSNTKEKLELYDGEHEIQPHPHDK